MKLKAVLKAAVVLLLFGLITVVVRFHMENWPQEQKNTDQQAVIHVLAPYEIRLHQQILNEIASEYSNGSGHKKVTFEYVAEEDYKKVICLRMDQGETPDLIICTNQMMPSLIEMGTFQNISQYVTMERKNSISYQSMWNSTRMNGKYYGLPFLCDPYMLFYDKDIFEKEKLQPPATWEDLVDTSRKVQQFSSYGFGFPGKQPDELSLFYACLLYSMGGSYQNINREAGIRSFQVIRTLQERKNISRSTINWSKKDLADVFASGQLEMMANTLSSLSEVRSKGAKFRVGITYLPKSVKSSEILTGSNIGIGRGANSEAYAFLDYLYRPDVMERIAYATDSLPVISGVPYRQKQIHTDDGEKTTASFSADGYSVEPYDAWFDISAAISDGVLKCLDSGSKESEASIASRVHDAVKISILGK
jgi:ABC-type sugar transport system, periplasmic component